jgi:hypothetical protein
MDRLIAARLRRLARRGHFTGSELARQYVERVG